MKLTPLETLISRMGWVTFFGYVNARVLEKKSAATFTAPSKISSMKSETDYVTLKIYSQFCPNELAFDDILFCVAQ